jgi:hypothetical protein
VLAATASIAVVLTVGFGTPPGRAWVSSAAEWLGGAPGGRVAEEVPVAVEDGAPDPAPAASAAPELPATRQARGAGPAEPAPGTSAAVGFDPRSNYVLIRFESRQRAGTAAIWVRDGASGSARVVAGYGAEALLPTADGLVVRNERSSRAEYVIVVPTRYRYLRVRVGDEPETLITIARSNRDWLWTLNLSE